MSYGAEVRRRLQLAAAGCAALFVLLLLLVWTETSFLVDLDHALGEPLASLSDDHPWVESIAVAVGSRRWSGWS